MLQQLHDTIAASLPADTASPEYAALVQVQGRLRAIIAANPPPEHQSAIADVLIPTLAIFVPGVARYQAAIAAAFAGISTAVGAAATTYTDQQGTGAIAYDDGAPAPQV